MGNGTGSEPRIIGTMASKGSVQTPNHRPIIGNPNAEEIYRELLMQHKARKLEDPVRIKPLNFSISPFENASNFIDKNIRRSILNWKLVT